MPLSADELMFFDKMPSMLPLYEILIERLNRQFADVTVKVGKTQISLRNRYVFAMASLPWRRMKDWPEQYLLISFGLSYQKGSVRIVQSVEAYPNRWTHHVIITQSAQIDEELLGWLGEAYEYSMVKG